MIYVCDAIMGSGKSSAAINYINEHPDDKFIYIAPLLDEAERIRKGCPNANLIEPMKLPQYDNKKSVHIEALIREGRNIASTHQAFKLYSPDMLDMVRQHGYTLIVDESVNFLNTIKCSPGDVKILVDSGVLEVVEGDLFTPTGKPYAGEAFRELVDAAVQQKLFFTMEDYDDDGKKRVGIFHWMLSPELLTSFKDVLVLTYMFPVSGMHHFMEIHDIPYENIGIQYDGKDYRFSKTDFYVPEYTKNLVNKIHVYEGRNLNDIGEKHNAFSSNWLSNSRYHKEVQNNTYNFFTNYCKGSTSDTRMWSTFNRYKSKLRGRGYSKGFVVYNERGTNKYSHKKHLAYLANVYSMVPNKIFYSQQGIKFRDKDYALSVLVQWLWRSAIRNGEDVWLYLPSSRMREELINWMEDFRK